MKVIKWRGLEILCANYDVVNGYVVFKFGENEIEVPEKEVEL